MKKVKDFMSRRVVYFKPSDTIFKAAKVFCKHRISGAPVVSSTKSKKILGIVSESDIVKFVGNNLCSKHLSMDLNSTSMTLIIFNLLRLGKSRFDFKKDLEKLSKIKIKDVMSDRVVSISPEDSILDAAEKMDKYDVNRLPVVSVGKLVGIIARADIVKALVDKN